MRYILDSADVNEYEKWSSYIEGFTTNPKLLDKVGLDIFTKAKKGLAFVQISSMEHFDTVKEYLVKKNVFCYLDIVWKIPMYPQFYYLFETLCESEAVAATMVYDMTQINQAVNFGCEYSMVYMAKNPDVTFFEKAVKIFGESDTKLIAASFRTKQDVERAIMSGIDYATIPPDVMSLAFNNLNVEKDIRENEQYRYNSSAAWK